MINIGIIGAEEIGREYLEGFLACRDTRIVALADRSPEKAHALASKYRLKSGERAVKIFADYRCLLPMVNAVAVATPDYSHATIVKDALAARKHVLCEKPLGINGLSAGATALLARAMGVIHMVRYPQRFTPIAAWLQRTVANGDFGDIRHIRARLTHNRMADPAAPFEWRHSREQSGYGVLGELGAPILDFALFVLGDKITVTEVSGSGQIFVHERRDPQLDTMRAVTAWDAASFSVKFSNGTLGTFDISRFSPDSNTFEIDGSKRSARYDLDRGTLGVYVFRGASREKVAYKPLRPAGIKLANEFQTFLQAIQEHHPVRPSFHDATHCLRILDAVDQSIREGKAVKPL